MENRAAAMTVVIPSVNGPDDLRACLDALAGEAGTVSLEVLLPERCGDAVRGIVQRDYPWVRVIPVETTTTIPAMRAVAFRAATAEVVAVIEDHVIVPAGWAQRLLTAIHGGAHVVGGSIENAATGTLVDRAAFLCEYSHCLRLPAGRVDWLVGNNVAYRRETLEQFRDVYDAGDWETRLHEAMRRRGIDLICRPEIVVGHRKHYSIHSYVEQRYLYARSYAGARIAHAAWPRRLAYAVGSLALPALLFPRIAARVLRGTGDGMLLLQCSPLIMVFVIAWAWGEVVGSALGAGDALQRVC